MNGVKVADTAIYMIMDRYGPIELPTEPIASPEARQRPAFVVPRFCNGLDQLQTFFGAVSPARRVHLVVELTELAIVLDKSLASTPARRRGRPS